MRPTLLSGLALAPQCFDSQRANEQEAKDVKRITSPKSVSPSRASAFVERRDPGRKQEKSERCSKRAAQVRERLLSVWIKGSA